MSPMDFESCKNLSVVSALSTGLFPGEEGVPTSLINLAKPLGEAIVSARFMLFSPAETTCGVLAGIKILIPTDALTAEFGV